MQGPLEVTIQELDGSFNHTFNIEENKTKFEITCHSKSRRYVDNLWFRPSSYCTTLFFSILFSYDETLTSLFMKNSIFLIRYL